MFKKENVHIPYSNNYVIKSAKLFTEKKGQIHQNYYGCKRLDDIPSAFCFSIFSKISYKESEWLL